MLNFGYFHQSIYYVTYETLLIRADVVGFCANQIVISVLTKKAVTSTKIPCSKARPRANSLLTTSK